MLWVVFSIFIICAFLMGAIPFAVYTGKHFLNKDIRGYGDGNPGAANVFKAGSIGWGFLAVFLEILKGMPFVLVAQHLDMSEVQIYSIGIAAILGHAFTPFLNFKGGKATAVTFGVLLAIPQKEIVIAFMIFMIAGFFFLDGDGWRIVLSIAGCILFASITDNSVFLILFLFAVLLVISVKNAEAIRQIPRPKSRIYIGFKGN